MRVMVNYLLEANAALILFLAVHQLLLKRETDFRVLRFFTLGALLAAILLPFIHLNRGISSAIPTVNNIIPEYWLPEIQIGGDPSNVVQLTTNRAYTAWEIAGWIYVAGVVVFLIGLLYQLISIRLMFRSGVSYCFDRFRIIESAEDKPTFSFFNLIYIGKADQLSATEKEQIIHHEREHARQWHSLDILLVTIVGVVFWFNPFIRHYKKIFIQLHEFEADARAVENSDVNRYCQLLARVALQAHFPIASHFNESLTVKRIEMMRTVKKKITLWKIAALAFSGLLCFFVIACQDQLKEVSQSTITQSGDYPEQVRQDMKKLMAEHPDAKLTYMEGEPSEIVKFSSNEEVRSRIVKMYDVEKDGVEKKGVLMSNIVQHAEQLKTEDKIFMVVEKQPEYVGGFDAVKKYMEENLHYPKEATKEGTVYVSMVITETGSLVDAAVVKGVEPVLDKEAVRVVSGLQQWIPGSQNGKNVKVRFVMPIKFNNGGQSKLESVQPDNDKMKVAHSIEDHGNQLIIRGRVTSAAGKGISGVNVYLIGTTQGTTTDQNGNFALETSQKKGEVSFSSIGYDTEHLSFASESR